MTQDDWRISRLTRVASSSVRRLAEHDEGLYEFLERNRKPAAIGSPTGSNGLLKKVTIILCQEPSADSLGDIGKAQHHKPLQSGGKTAGLAILVPPPVTWIYCARGILANFSKASATHVEGSSVITTSHSAGCGIVRASPFVLGLSLGADSVELARVRGLGCAGGEVIYNNGASIDYASHRAAWEPGLRFSAL